jgi:hypothetical protein
MLRPYGQRTTGEGKSMPKKIIKVALVVNAADGACELRVGIDQRVGELQA